MVLRHLKILEIIASWIRESSRTIGNFKRVGKIALNASVYANIIKFLTVEPNYFRKSSDILKTITRQLASQQARHERMLSAC